jgi:hypothetical protein
MNLKNARSNMLQLRDLKCLRTIDLSLSNGDENYHLLDLMKYYSYDDNKGCFISASAKEPIALAFHYFIVEWEKELEELTK